MVLTTNKMIEVLRYMILGDSHQGRSRKGSTPYASKRKKKRKKIKRKQNKQKVYCTNSKKYKKLKTRWKKRPKIGGHFSHQTNKDGIMSD